MNTAPATRRRKTRDRLSDIRFMARTYETPTGAAERLGITIDGLGKFLREHNRADVFARLAANDPMWGEHK